MRALAGLRLEDLAGGMRSDASIFRAADVAHFRMLTRQVERFLRRPGETSRPPASQSAPPGAPIGAFAREWLAPPGSSCEAEGSWR